MAAGTIDGTYENRSRTAARGVVRALTDGVNLVVAGSAAFGALLVQSWSILALAAAAYGALVAWDLSSVEFWKRVVAGPPGARPTLPDPAGLTDPSARSAVYVFNSARQALSRVLADTPDVVKTRLAVTMAAVESLEAEAADLIARAEQLGRYLATANLSGVRQEIDRLASLERTACEPAKLEYAAARGAREEQLQSLMAITSARERVGAQLDRIVACMEALPPRIVRMRTLDEEGLERLSDEVKSQLSDIQDEILGVEGILAAAN